MKIRLFIPIVVFLFVLFAGHAFAAEQIINPVANKPPTPIVQPKTQGNLISPNGVGAAEGETASNICDGFWQQFTLKALSSQFILFRPIDQYCKGIVNAITAPRDLVLSLITSIPSNIILGQNCSDVDTWISAANVDKNGLPVDSGTAGNKCVPFLPTAHFAAYVTREQQANAGALGYLATNMETIASDPPVPGNMAYFWNDTVNKSMFGRSAYAQSINLTVTDPFFQRTVFGLWKASRNIAMTLLALLLGVGALGVMFRQKIGGQAIVTIYSILPYVPVVIFLILFSYPIMVALMNMGLGLWSVGGLAAQSIGLDVFGEEFGTMAANSRGTVLSIANLSINRILTGLLSFVPAALSMVFVVLFMALLFVVMIATILYQYIKTYMRFVYYTIFAPIVFLLAILPGNQKNIMYFLRIVLVEVIVFPYIIVTFFIGFGILWAVPFNFISIFDESASPWKMLVSGSATFFGLIVIFMISWSFIWGITKARKNIEGFFGVSGGSIWGPPKR